MKKHLLAVVLFCTALLPLEIKSQDIIRTKFGKEINCKITKIDSVYIYYYQIKSDTKINSTIERVNVEMFANDYYSASAPISNKTADTSKVIKQQPAHYEHFRLGVDLGWGWRTARTAPSLTSEQRQIAEGLRSGLSYGLNAEYYFRKKWGIGLRVLAFNTWDDFDAYYAVGPGYYSKIIKHNSFTLFAGPEIIYRYVSLERKNVFWVGFGIGYLGYNESFSGWGSLQEMSGSTVGGVWDVGYDIRISQHFALGVALNLTSGSLFEVTYKNADGSRTTVDLSENNTAEGLARIGVTVGLRYYK